MVGGQHFVTAEVHPLSPEMRNAAVCLQQRLRSGCAETHNHFRLKHIQLAKQKWRAFRYFVRLRLTISGRAALHDVADIDITTVEAHRFNHLREKFSGATDKRQSLRIFIRAWAFAHKNELCFSASIAEHNFVACLVQLAARALAKIFADFQQRFACDFARTFKQRWTNRDWQHRENGSRSDVWRGAGLHSGFSQDGFLGSLGWRFNTRCWKLFLRRSAIERAQAQILVEPQSRVQFFLNCDFGSLRHRMFSPQTDVLRSRLAARLRRGCGAPLRVWSFWGAADRGHRARTG